MSERGGSDVFEFDAYNESIRKFNFSVAFCRIRLFPTLILKLKSLWSEKNFVFASYPLFK